ncbi:MAG: tyrosine-type recombinase/integrase [Actinobacteria bacterium]|nr:tyrosine-type recombinase/integrase [Actinomycetota bacterium]
MTESGSRRAVTHDRSRPPAIVAAASSSAPAEVHRTHRLSESAMLVERFAGVGPVTPYSLRHTSCTILSADGVRAELVADVLGHVDTRMVLRHYRHPA